MKFSGEKLKAQRVAKKLDQHALAELGRRRGAGITQSQISRYENGHGEPSGRNALALAAALDVGVNDLYDAEVEAPFPAEAA